MMFDDYSKEQVKLLATLSGVMMLAIFAANIAAVKLWNLWGIAVDGGLIIFPLTYIVGDILVELYGQRDNYRSDGYRCHATGLPKLGRANRVPKRSVLITPYHCRQSDWFLVFAAHQQYELPQNQV